MPNVQSRLQRRLEEYRAKKRQIVPHPNRSYVSSRLAEGDVVVNELRQLIVLEKEKKLRKAIFDLAVIELDKEVPHCIYPIGGNFNRLCGADIPEHFADGLLCAHHNGKCTEGVKDSVIKHELSHYRHGKKCGQDNLFDLLAKKSDGIQNAAVNEMSQQLGATSLNANAPCRTTDIVKLENDNMSKSKILAEGGDRAKRAAKKYYNLTRGFDLRKKVGEREIVDACNALAREALKLNDTLADLELVEAMETIVEELTDDRMPRRTHANRFVVQDVHEY